MKYPEARKSALKDRLLPLLRHDAPSGCEEAVLAYLAEQAQPYCRHVSYDNFGNLICHVGGSGPRMMVCAHADQVGFIIKSISPEGFLFFHKVGGTPDKQLEARQVLVNGTVPGIIGCKPGHLMTAAEKNTVTPPSELFIDIGVSSRAEAEALGIEVGSYAVQRYNYMEMADPDLICSRGLDDRAGCAVVLELLAGIDPAALRYDLYIVFSLQEELGLRGAQAAACGLQPAYGIAVDTVPCADTPGVNWQRDLPLRLGGGFCLSVNEGGAQTTFANPAMVRQAKALAKQHNIPMQVAATAGYAGTDAQAIATHGAGAKTLTMTIPRRYSHSAVELLNVGDALALLDMLQVLLQSDPV